MQEDIEQVEQIEREIEEMKRLMEERQLEHEINMDFEHKIKRDIVLPSVPIVIYRDLGERRLPEESKRVFIEFNDTLEKQKQHSFLKDFEDRLALQLDQLKQFQYMVYLKINFK